MTVAELVLELTKMPGRAEVVTEQYTCGQTHLVPIAKNEVRLSEDKKTVILGEAIN